METGAGEGAREKREARGRKNRKGQFLRRKFKWKGKGIAPLRGATRKEGKGTDERDDKRVKI